MRFQIPKKLTFNPIAFLFSLLAIFALSFASFFLAFGIEDEEAWYNLRQVSYRAFQVFRFPASHIAIIRNVFSDIIAQLVFNSVFYALILTGFISNFPKVNAARS